MDATLHGLVSVSFALGVWVLVLGAGRVVSGATVRIAVEGGLTAEDLLRLREGDSLMLRCEASGLQPDETVVWQRGFDGEVLASGNRTDVERTVVPRRGDDSATRDEDVRLAVEPLLGADTGPYRCRVARYDADSGLYLVQASAEVAVGVYFFPAGGEEGPVCSPAGPVDVVPGQSVELSCSTAKGYPTVNLTVSSPAIAGLQPAADWPLVEARDSLSKTFQWTPSVAHSEAVTLTCHVTSSHFPDASASCVIGPIRVVPRPTALPSSPPADRSSTAARTTVGPPRSSDMPRESQVFAHDSPCFQWLVAFVASAGLCAVSLCANVLSCAALLRLRKDRESERNDRAQAALMETAGGNGRNRLSLQLTGLNNRCFTVEPLTDVGSSSPR